MQSEQAIEQPVDGGVEPVCRSGLALAIQVAPVQAQTMKDMSAMPPVVKDNMARMQKEEAGKMLWRQRGREERTVRKARIPRRTGDQARDPKSFVLLPAGDCSKIQGGKLQAS